MKKLILLLSHLLFGLGGFAAGIYTLPILIAPPSPSTEQVLAIADRAPYTGYFERQLPGSDRLHWAEGNVFVSAKNIAFQGKIAPGPDYKVYLSPDFVRDEAEFMQLRGKMRRVAQVESFSNQILELPRDVSIEHYNTVVIWCEAFGQFISAAQYR